MTNKAYLRYTWFVLIMVFFVILAGAVVRMTQSGMGCPDWPKCFGRWIPPVNESQLPPDFEKYLRQQDIDHTFNVYHTWIEYINRLLGALLGVFIFIHFIWSYLRFRKINKPVVILSFLLLLAVGFQGWLGKKVVDHNLAVVKVTIHMLVALVIAALPLMIIYRLKKEERIFNKALKGLAVLLLLLLLIQVILGTQVREQIDEIAKSHQFGQRELWIGQLDKYFYVHRSLSWIILLSAGLVCWKAWGVLWLRNHALFILGLVILTAILGVIMNFYAIPAIVQPLHLFLASVLIVTVFAFRLRLK